jgi:pimeloyl-ACP methyl ester carboxylesterase
MIQKQYSGMASGQYCEGSYVYTSSIDPSINNIVYNFCYDVGYCNLPMIVLQHGWTTTIANLPEQTMRRFAERGFFVLAADMRGRNGASGANDASGRELMDVYDAIQHALARFPGLINPRLKTACGWSGGGGNMLAMATKFPDLFGLVIDNFGMSDYIYDPTFSWEVTDNTFSFEIQAAVGGDRVTKPNESRCRSIVDKNAIAKNFKGKLIIIHDVDDNVVDITHSSRVKDSYDAVANTNYVYHTSNSSSQKRFEHGIGTVPVPIVQAEQLWISEPLQEVIVPTSGTLEIQGMLLTKRFSIWLGNGTAADDGRNRCATVVYNTVANTYSVTTQLSGAGNTTVRITLADGRIATGTISGSATQAFTPV